MKRFFAGLLGPTALALVLAFALGLASAPIASAADGEAQLGLSLGYAAALDPKGSLHGGSIALRPALGLTNSLWLAADLGWSPLFRQGHLQHRQAYLVGLRYSLDVFSTVPSVEISMGSAQSLGRFRPTLQASGLLEHFVAPDLSLGAEFAWRLSPTLSDSQLWALRLLFNWRLEL